MMDNDELGEFSYCDCYTAKGNSFTLRPVVPTCRYKHFVLRHILIQVINIVRCFFMNPHGLLVTSMLMVITVVMP